MSRLTPEELEKRKVLNKKIFKYFLLPIIGIFILIIVISPSDSEEAKPIPVVRNNALDASVFQVENYLKKNLNDPNSYEGIEWSPVIIDSADGHLKNYTVRHKYRAKNGFGGFVVENRIFYLDSAGTIYNVLGE